MNPINHFKTPYTEKSQQDVTNAPKASQTIPQERIITRKVTTKPKVIIVNTDHGFCKFFL